MCREGLRMSQLSGMKMLLFLGLLINRLLLPLIIHTQPRQHTRMEAKHPRHPMTGISFCVYNLSTP